jgi:transcriptional regulator with XRE-family HTH domain
MKIGDRIKSRRIELGLSVDELAEKIGKNRSTVYRYENSDIGKLPTDILGPLITALNVSPDYLMCWEDLPPKTNFETDKIATLLAKRKDITALINFIGDNEEKISPEDIEKTMNMIEMFFVNK